MYNSFVQTTNQSNSCCKRNTIYSRRYDPLTFYYSIVHNYWFINMSQLGIWGRVFCYKWCRQHSIHICLLGADLCMSSCSLSSEPANKRNAWVTLRNKLNSYYSDLTIKVFICLYKVDCFGTLSFKYFLNSSMEYKSNKIISFSLIWI